MEKVNCQISGKEVLPQEAQPLKLVRPGVLRLIKKDHPKIDVSGYISLDELSAYRKKYLHILIKKEAGELNRMERDVVAAISGNRILSENVEYEMNEQLSFGQKLADRIAEFGGSWTFILIFFAVLLGWIVLNVVALAGKAFDPYPFILLNLILSCLAAIQAPIIMMSQNRQEAKDRIRGEHDFKVNLKAELEIQLLHEKLDHLMVHQNQGLLEIQELQADYLEDILKLLRKNSGGGEMP